ALREGLELTGRYTASYDSSSEDRLIITQLSDVNYEVTLTVTQLSASAVQSGTLEDRLTMVLATESVLDIHETWTLRLDHPANDNLDVLVSSAPPSTALAQFATAISANGNYGVSVIDDSLIIDRDHEPQTIAVEYIRDAIPEAQEHTKALVVPTPPETGDQWTLTLDSDDDTFDISGLMSTASDDAYQSIMLALKDEVDGTGKYTASYDQANPNQLLITQLSHKDFVATLESDNPAFGRPASHTTHNRGIINISTPTSSEHDIEWVLTFNHPTLPNLNRRLRSILAPTGTANIWDAFGPALQSQQTLETRAFRITSYASLSSYDVWGLTLESSDPETPVHNANVSLPGSSLLETESPTHEVTHRLTFPDGDQQNIAVLTFTETPVAGDTWTLTIDSEDNSFDMAVTATAQDGTLEPLLAELSGLLTASGKFTGTSNPDGAAGELLLTQHADVPFAVNLDIDGSASGSLQASPGNPNWTLRTISAGGFAYEPISSGADLVATLAAALNTQATFRATHIEQTAIELTTTIEAGDELTIVLEADDSTTDLTNVISQSVIYALAPYDPSMPEWSLTVVDATDSRRSVSALASLDDTPAAALIALVDQINSQMQRVITFPQPPQLGDVWKLRLDSQDAAFHVELSATATDTSYATIIQSLLQGLNEQSGYTGIHLEETEDQLTITQLATTPFDVSLRVVNINGDLVAGSSAITVTDHSTSPATAFYLSDPLSIGFTYDSVSGPPVVELRQYDTSISALRNQIVDSINESQTAVTAAGQSSADIVLQIPDSAGYRLALAFGASQGREDETALKLIAELDAPTTNYDVSYASITESRQQLVLPFNHQIIPGDEWYITASDGTTSYTSHAIAESNTVIHDALTEYDRHRVTVQFPEAPQAGDIWTLAIDSDNDRFDISVSTTVGTADYAAALGPLAASLSAIDGYTARHNPAGTNAAILEITQLDASDLTVALTSRNPSAETITVTEGHQQYIDVGTDTPTFEHRLSRTVIFPETRRPGDRWALELDADDDRLDRLKEFTDPAEFTFDTPQQPGFASAHSSVYLSDLPNQLTITQFDDSPFTIRLRTRVPSAEAISVIESVKESVLAIPTSETPVAGEWWQLFATHPEEDQLSIATPAIPVYPIADLPQALTLALGENSHYAVAHLGAAFELSRPHDGHELSADLVRYTNTLITEFGDQLSSFSETFTSVINPSDVDLSANGGDVIVLT
ncbi:MAG: hypothetical protein ABGX16_22095, partial [Pirellulales bacterium]